MLSSKWVTVLALLIFSFLTGCETPLPPAPPLDYRLASFLEAGSIFSRSSKIVIEIDPDVSIEFRGYLGKVEPAAKNAGLNCVALADAEYLLVITTDTFDHPSEGKGHAVFGIKGKAYRLSDGGKKRSVRHEWEASSSGIKPLPRTNGLTDYLRPPWVDVDRVVDLFVSSIGIQKRSG